MSDESDVHVRVHRPYQPEIDVTAAVKTMYDLLHSSMDWGSHFLSIEEVIEVTRLAEVCDFIGLEGAQEQMVAYMSALDGVCPICKFRGHFVLWEVTEQGRIARLQNTSHLLGQTPETTYDSHHAILIQPQHEPAYLYWPDLEEIHPNG